MFFRMDVFKIFYGVVALVRISMVDMKSFWSWSNEILSNKPMNSYAFPFSSTTTKCYFFVASSCKRWLQYFRSFYSPFIRDEVIIFKECYFLPLFFHTWIISGNGAWDKQ